MAGEIDSDIDNITSSPRKEPVGANSNVDISDGYTAAMVRHNLN